MPKKGPQPTALAPDAPHPLPRLPSSTPSPSPLDWIPVVSLPLECSAEHFHAGLAELVLQPEHSSSTILRADIQADDQVDNSPHPGVVPLEGYRCVRRVRRRILPNRPQFDWPMEQECLFYERSPTGEADDDDALEREGLVLLLPDFEQLRQEDSQGRLPYYHPQLHALAFRYLPSSPAASLRIDLIPLPSQATTAPLPPSDRLYRTSLVLVKFAAKLCAGHAAGWQKRVHHDLLAGKEEVQDLYQQLKDKYNADIASQSPRITFRWMLASWRESTDATKHVFEDVAIAAWLIVLWREMYLDTDGKPPGGFVDIGCGNGLLVYILCAEGYPGYGFDLRERKSWSAYAPAPDLRVSSISPPALVSAYLSSSTPPFPEGAFLIGNHADELTPWLPLLAACTPRSAFLSIPCCLHELHGRFDRQAYTIPAAYLALLPSAPPAPGPAPVLDTHLLLHPFYAPTPLAFAPSAGGASVSGGRYAAYQLYLAHLALRCGFVPEREALRIPSTKNFGMIGRRRVWSAEGDEGDEGEERVREELRALLGEVERRGEWKARRPEGKAGEKDH
ncbi:tRNA(Ser) Um(44) 2'-O-methyltransferase [Rhodotorula kratochvilovae]